MARLGLETHLVDGDVYQRTLARFRDAGVVLPTFGELKDPSTIPPAIAERLAAVDPDAPHPLNLFRVHWFNDDTRRGRRGDARRDRTAARTDRRAGAHRAGARRPLPDDPRSQGSRRLRLPRATRRHRPVRPDAPPRDLAFDRQLLPRRRRHLAHPRLPRRRGAAGEHEPGTLRLARSLGRRPGRHRPHAGSESNVKEIYDACAALERDPANIVFNQFCEYGNYLVHRLCTGAALERVFYALPQVGRRPGSPLLFRPPDRPERSPRATISRRRSAPRSRRSRRSSARPCSTTALASTTSRASATSTCR